MAFMLKASCPLSELLHCRWSASWTPQTGPHRHHRHHNRHHHHRNHHYRWLLDFTVEALVMFNTVLHAASTQQQSVNNNGSRVPILGIMMAVLCVVQ